eukprot:scaffold131511_cov63-Phaeocystis_antarctica.AAC.1
MSSSRTSGSSTTRFARNEGEQCGGEADGGHNPCAPTIGHLSSTRQIAQTWHCAYFSLSRLSRHTSLTLSLRNVTAYAPTTPTSYRPGAARVLSASARVSRERRERVDLSSTFKSVLHSLMLCEESECVKEQACRRERKVPGRVPEEVRCRVSSSAGHAGPAEDP